MYLLYNWDVDLKSQGDAILFVMSMDSCKHYNYTDHEYGYTLQK